jgi:hypothetical protein
MTDALGPLAVSATNPRYFTAGTGNAADRRLVYLTGSHINNFLDGAGPGSVEWHNVNSRETLAGAADLTVQSNGSRSFTSPFGAAPSVLYLKEVSF